MEAIESKVDFVKEIEKLKTVTRFNRTLDGRFENSAEHSWQVALVANLFQDYFPEKLDIGKVTLMLLLHDLGEIYAGDTWVYDTTGKAVSHDKEYLSLQKSLAILPTFQGEKFTELWLEFEKGNSPEARYARIIDALVPLINHLVVSEEGYNPDKLTAERVLTKKAFIKEDSEILWQLAKELIEKSVEKGLYD
ncbi:hydrolase [Streptococcus equinus]|jgi:putative hydrolase of HD superfamily|uniref:HD domain-containing protein n=1 Tax=Streptococcus equinus TaxID=1335 RepID=UPI000F7162EE|nr:HD domain-containing protein [Streptococcus equinus]VED91026.1 hydrolase [Streptococcus equinus]VTS83602.1 hydrolase [Streptococcus equinus]